MSFCAGPVFVSQRLICSSSDLKTANYLGRNDAWLGLLQMAVSELIMGASNGSFEQHNPVSHEVVLTA